MRPLTTAIATLAALAALASTPALAQVPYIQGTWTLNVAASHLPPGPPPRSEVRTYRLRPDGVLIGLSVSIAPDGTPNFLIFSGKPDGRDIPEFDTRTAARYLADGAPPPLTYTEIATPDGHRVKWVDKAAGHVVGSGEKWVSPDGKTMTITVDGADQRIVFDRTGP